MCQRNPRPFTLYLLYLYIFKKKYLLASVHVFSCWRLRDHCSVYSKYWIVNCRVRDWFMIVVVLTFTFTVINTVCKYTCLHLIHRRAWNRLTSFWDQCEKEKKIRCTSGLVQLKQSVCHLLLLKPPYSFTYANKANTLENVKRFMVSQ